MFHSLYLNDTEQDSTDQAKAPRHTKTVRYWEEHYQAHSHEGAVPPPIYSLPLPQESFRSGLKYRLSFKYAKIHFLLTMLMYFATTLWKVFLVVLVLLNTLMLTTALPLWKQCYRSPEILHVWLFLHSLDLNLCRDPISIDCHLAWMMYNLSCINAEPVINQRDGK